MTGNFGRKTGINYKVKFINGRNAASAFVNSERNCGLAISVTELDNLLSVLFRTAVEPSYKHDTSSTVSSKNIY